MDQPIKFARSPSDVEKVLKRLGQFMCPWCCARFLGVTDISFYKQEPVDALLQLAKETSNRHEMHTFLTMRPSDAVCNGCFGVLTDFVNDAFLDTVSEKVAKSDFEYEHFSCSIGLPVSSVVRDYTYLLMCADVVPETYTYLPLDEIPSVKDIWKWICGRRLENRLGKKFELGFLEILIEFEQNEMEAECTQLLRSFPDHFRKRKNSKQEMYTRKTALEAIGSVSRDKFRRIMPYPPANLSKLGYNTAISISHCPVYVAGRYNKYSRELSQSPWLIEGVRKGETSVAEIITDPLLNMCRTDDYYFTSSGREDVDVRMLGRGRPFCLQIMNPRRVIGPLLRSVQQTINSTSKDVMVRDLQIVTLHDTEVIKDLETEKRKTYAALCRSTQRITQNDLDLLLTIKDLMLDQKTPIRVLHRRALATRQRAIHWLKGCMIADSDHLFSLTLETQAGAYVKEFVHSDFGRTQPSLGSLLGDRELDILELDVLNVDVDWPPSLDDLDPPKIT